MVQNGFIPIEDYPKYIIPYTPIAFALLLGVLLIPLFQRLTRKLDLLHGSLFSVAMFFIAERIMEIKVLVQTQELIPLESWQMSLCYIPPEQYESRTWEAVDVLLGGYSPAFKLHFYLISVVIIVSLLNCLYGFAKMIRSGDFGRKKALAIPAIIAVLVTFTVYIGEMILLSGNLYRFGNSFLFDGLESLVLAPVDLLVIIISGVITLLICQGLNHSERLTSVG